MLCGFESDLYQTEKEFVHLLFYRYRLSIWDILSVLFWNRIFSSWPSCFYFLSAGITGGSRHVRFVILSFSTGMLTSDFLEVTCLCCALPSRYCCITFANILWRMFKSVWKMLVCSFLFCVILISSWLCAGLVRKKMIFALIFWQLFKIGLIFCNILNLLVTRVFSLGRFLIIWGFYCLLVCDATKDFLFDLRYWIYCHIILKSFFIVLISIRFVMIFLSISNTGNSILYLKKNLSSKDYNYIQRVIFGFIINFLLLCLTREGRLHDIYVIVKTFKKCIQS